MTKNNIENKEFEGERPLYAMHGLHLYNVTIHAGESALKECSNIVCENCRFEGKYPLWNTVGFKVNNCVFTEAGRAALWYSENLEMTDTLVEAPKMFRDMKNLHLNSVKLTNAQETLWNCQGIRLENVTADNADYIMMHSSDIEIDHFTLNGNYSFQYSKNIVIRNSILNTKDAFWETDNCTVYDSEINGEYLAWNSRNLRLVRCHITGTQPLCYCENLVLEDCTFGQDADLALEYSSVQGNIKGHIVSIKNPRTGNIAIDSVGEIIIDNNIKAPADCKVIVKNDKKCV